MSNETNNVNNASNESNAATPAASPAEWLIWNNDESTGGKAAIEIIKGKDGLDGHRAVFGDLAAAVARIGAITEMMESSDDAHVRALAATMPVAAAGVGDIKTLDSLDNVPYVNQPVIVTALGAKGNKRTGIRGLVIMPLPTVSDFLADSTGAAFVAKVVEKEVAHVGLRKLRNEAANGTAAIYAAAKESPSSVTEYAEESTRSGVDTSAFDKIWSELRKSLAKTAPALVESLPRQRSEIINGIRSASWAKAMYPDLEAPGVFVGLAKLAIQVIDRTDDLESDEVAGWLAGRDELNLTVRERVELTEAVDFSQISL